MIYVLATIRVQPGKRDDFLEEFQKLVPQVRAESGCRQYGPAVDAEATGIDAQRLVGPDAVVVVELWDSVEALKKHLAIEHMVTFRERVKDLVVETSLQILTPPVG